MIKLKRVNLFLTFLFSVVLWSPYLPAADYDAKDVQNYKRSVKEKQSDLEILRYKIKNKEKIIEDIKNKKQDLSKELDKIDKKLTKTEQILKTLQKDIKKIANETKTAEEKLLSSNQNLNNYKKDFKNELDIFYKRNLNRDFLKIIAENNSSAYFARADKALKHLILRDSQSLVKTQEEISNLEILKGSLTEKNKELESLNNTVSLNKGSYLITKVKKAKLLKTVENKQLEEERQINNLKECALQLEALITDLRFKLSDVEKRRLKSSGLVHRRGNLIWPVTGEVISLFGKYKRPDLNAYLFNNGIEIKSKKGTGVLAVEEGAVLFASDFKGYGKTVIIEHSQELCTVYSHLGEIKVNPGQFVNKKDVIGTLDEASLYFEIRLDNKPEDPLLWLTSEGQER